MQKLVLVLAAAALLSFCRASNVNRHMKLMAEMDNHIQPNAVPSRDSLSKRFLMLTRKPPALTVRRAGAGVEVTCEALAAPAPSVHWYRNDAPIYEYDLESNEIMDTNPKSLARITATLLVPRSPDTATYTCLVLSGTKTSRASAVVVGSDSVDLTERSKLMPLAPRILVMYKVLVDLIGTNVVLPCRARGHPRPQIVWRDNNNTVIRKDSRMKVLRSGELVISGLRWSDMGEYHCHATNMFGTAHNKTFVYPARPSGTDG